MKTNRQQLKLRGMPVEFERNCFLTSTFRAAERIFYLKLEYPLDFKKVSETAETDSVMVIRRLEQPPLCVAEAEICRETRTALSLCGWLEAEIY